MPTNLKTRKLNEGEKILYREFTLDRAAIDKKARTVPIAFSSETDQVERWDGIEILDHGKNSIRLGRLTNNAPLLLEHDRYKQIGKVESARVDKDKVGRALVRFGKGKKASEIFDDVLDGIRSKVSVGYVRYERTETDEGTDLKPVYRVTDWEPMEISIVSIAADDSVGVGRDADQLHKPTDEVKTMKEKNRGALPDAPNANPGGEPDSAARGAGVDQAAERKAVRDAETARVRDIRAIGERHNVGEELIREYVDGERSVDEFRTAVLDNLDDTPARAPSRHSDVDLNASENNNYSVIRAMRAATSGDWRKAGFEQEISEEISRQLGRETEGVFIPTNLRHTPEMMARVMEISGGRMMGRAPLEAATDASGGYTVQTSVMTLIEMLRNRMMVRRMGARVLGGLQGDLSFPRQATGSAFTWVAETPGSDVSDSDATFDQVALAPKTGQSSTAYSRQLLNQSSVDVEMFVRDDLTQAGGLGIDLAALHGTGASNQPEGIINVSGIGDVAGGANGLAPTWAHIVELETDVSVANADVGTMGYLTNAKVRGKLKTTEKASGTAQFVWGDENVEPGISLVNGYRAGVSNQVASDLDKGTSTGVCSAIFFGNWDDLLIGEWGAIELIVDPYRLKKQGLIEVTSFVMADIAVRHAQSFSVMKDALTQ